MPGTHIPEILDLIASFVDDNTLLSLRLVSRLHNQTSLRAFADAWFDIICIYFTVSSVQRLYYAASHDVIRRRVRKVRAMVKFGLGIFPDDVQFRPRRDNYESGLTSIAGSFICWALRRLTRCAELEILGLFPYFAAELTTEPVTEAIYSTCLILSVFGYEDCPPIRSVTIDDKSPVSPNYGSAESIMMLEEITGSPSFRRGWGSRVRNIRFQGSLLTPNMPYVSNMIQAATNLESLELTARDPTEDRVLPIPAVPMVHPMTRLAIWNIITTPELLATHVTRYRMTLRSFDLCWVCMPSDVEMWSTFFGLLAEFDFPCLTTVSTYELMGVSEAGSGEPVYFRNLIGATEALRGCTGRFESTACFKDEALSGLRYTGSPGSMRYCFRALSEGVSEALAPFPEVNDGPLPDAISSLAEAFEISTN